MKINSKMSKETSNKDKKIVYSIFISAFNDLRKRWRTALLCYGFELLLLVIIVFATFKYYGPVDQSVATIKEILDDSNNRDAASLQKLSSREAELKTLQDSISNYVWNFVVIMVIGFVLISSITYTIIGDKFDIRRLLLFILLFLATQIVLIALFGLILDLKTAIMSNIWVSERTFISSSFFLIAVFLGNFIATTICIESFKCDTSKLKFDKLIWIFSQWFANFKSRGIKMIFVYLFLNCITIGIFFSAFFSLAFPLGTISVFLSLAIIFIALPAWKIFSKAFIIQYLKN